MPVHRRGPRPVRHIVFYGTLRAGYKAHTRLKLESALAYVGRCVLRGTLYDLGPYPGFVPGTGTAEGELYRIKDQALLRRLDAFEGFDVRKPDRSPYIRELIRVPRSALGSALHLPAWIYVFNGTTTGRREVPGGVWPRGRGAQRPRE